MIVNRVAECYDGKGSILPLLAVRAVIVHRTDLKLLTPNNPHPIPDALLDGPGLCRAFMAHDLGTGRRPPYHVLIRQDGIAEQCLPLSIAGAHCVGRNHQSLAVAVVGDFRHILPSAAQWDALVWVVAQWMPINGGLDTVGHSEIPNGSHDPNKICPGRHINVRQVEIEALRSLPQGWRLWSPEGCAAELAGAEWVL